MSDYILVIDEGTTSTRAMVFDRDFKTIAMAQQEIPLAYPADGWVEQDGEQIWQQTLKVCRDVIAQAGGASKIAAIGITNQRETTLVWDRETSKLIGPAIIWQDRRTSEACEAMKAKGLEAEAQAETGLLLDPYFSGTKLAWLLDHTPGAREAAAQGRLAFGTVDAFLIWRLTGGKVHATDTTNASRTLLYRIGLGGAGGWSEEMCAALNIPKSILPEVRDSAADFGMTDPALFGAAIPIRSAIGDQQAALVGQGCLAPGEAKITYGTGAFLVANSGAVKPVSKNKLLATIGYTSPGASAFALEGSIFNAGTVVKWLRDDLKMIASSSDSETVAAALPDNGGVYIVPAFTGLGAPHWRADARGVISGLTRAATASHLVRAGLESVAYQTRDLLGAFEADGVRIAELRVDGGMAGNDWLMQFIADVCARPVVRPDETEATALGAAVLAGVQSGWLTLKDWGARPIAAKRFTPAMNADARTRLLGGWNDALKRAL